MRHDPLDISFGLKHQPQGYLFATDHYDKFQIIAVHHGTLHCETADGQKNLGPGSIAVLRPASTFQLSCPDEAYSGLFVLSPTITRPGFEGPSFIGEPPPLVAQSIERLEAEIHASAPWANDLADAMARQVVWQTLRWLEPSGPSPRQSDPYADYWARRVRDAIDISLYTDSTAREAVAHLRFSYRQLSRIFHSVFGLSPKQYQVQARIRIACELLASTEQPVSGIAAELHYPSSQHFAAQFRKICGVSPSQYRSGKRQPDTHLPTMGKGALGSGISG